MSIRLEPPPLRAPFDRNSAENSQAAWAKTCNVSAQTRNSVGMDFVIVPPGDYMRGYSKDNIEADCREFPEFEGAKFGDHDQHRTVLTKPMLVGVYKVTQTQYSLVVGHNPSAYSRHGRLASHVEGQNTDQFPVDYVTWYDCIQACNLLSEREGMPPYYRIGGRIALWDDRGINSAEVDIVGGTGYRLLTSAEWEFVCRAGTETLYYFGDWMDEGHLPAPVGSDGPNNFGIYDLCSYHEEWCFDASSIDSYAKFVGGTAVDPVDFFDKDLERVIRGLNSCVTGSEHAANNSERTSFRVCRTLTSAAPP